MRFESFVGDRHQLFRACLTLLVGATVVGPLCTPPAVAQEPGGRFRVLVVPIETDDFDRRFGDRVADMISDRLQEFPTHTPISERDFKRALRRYDVEKEDLNAIKARQLANLMGAQVVFFGTISESEGSRGHRVEAQFIDVNSGDQIDVPAVTVTDGDRSAVEAVTDAAISAFEEAVRFQRAQAFCADYVGSQQPENALRNCNEALSINPNSTGALFNKALAFRQLFENDTTEAVEWADSAIFYFDEVLDREPGHRNALQNAAYVYSRMGAAEKASELYKQYLELDPRNIPVRLKVAYDLAQADLMKEAVEILEAGLKYDSTDVNLLQSLGDYALRYSSEDSAYVDVALDAYENVLEIKGEETDLSLVENALAAYTRAGRSSEAIEFAEKALAAHPDSPRLWSLYADALAKADRYTDAVAAMDSTLALDASYPNGHLRRGRFKLQAGQEQAAHTDFQLAIETGTSSREDIYRLFWSEAHAARDRGAFTDALSHFENAARYAQGTEERQHVEFWWGYTNYQLGERIASAEDASLASLRRAQNYFQAAKEHFQRAGQVRKEVGQFREAADKWLLNVEARIKRATRG